MIYRVNNIMQNFKEIINNYWEIKLKIKIIKIIKKITNNIHMEILYMIIYIYNKIKIVKRIILIYVIS